MADQSLKSAVKLTKVTHLLVENLVVLVDVSDISLVLVDTFPRELVLLIEANIICRLVSMSTIMNRYTHS